MRLRIISVLAPLVVCASIASATSFGNAHSKVVRRDAAIHDSPTGSYVPETVGCPRNLHVRQSSIRGRINSAERNYVRERARASTGLWKSYLRRVGLKNFDITRFIAKSRANEAVPGETLPNIAIAISGGGLRAMLVGGGILAAFDNRNHTAVSHKTGGILQLANYMAGLSGGSWLTGSYALSGFPTFEALLDQVWDLTEPLLGPMASHPLAYADAAKALAEKAIHGFPVSFVDVYGRLLSYHLLNDTKDTTGPGSQTLLHAIRDQPGYKRRSGPFPLMVALGRENHTTKSTLDTVIYELSPEEFAVNHPTIPGAYLPIEYLGTAFNAGKLASNSCVIGFDNAGLVMGASSDVFGDENADNEAAAGLTPITSIPQIAKVLDAVPDDEVLTARIPNPFHGLHPHSYGESSQKILNLMDGALGGENIPFWPLSRPDRKVDVVIAIDASDDADGYPNGFSLYQTYRKSKRHGYDSHPFPVMPKRATFVSHGLNKRPTFFGCHSTRHAPLIVYVPNYDATYPTNTSTYQTNYTTAAQQGFFDNSFAIATQSHATHKLAEAWPECLACALVDAQVKRNGVRRTKQCESCFQHYCY